MIKMPTEHIEQVNFVNWMRYNHPNIWVAAIPNGGKRSIKVAKELKAEGVSAGFPDLFIPELMLLIEMKRIKGSSTSIEQKQWHEYLINCGYTVEICKGCDAAKQIIINMVDSTK